MVHVEVLVLVLLTPHDAGQLVLGGHGVGTVLGEDHRAAVQDLCPAVHLLAEGGFGVHDAHAAHDVPAVVAVQADEVSELLALAVVGQAHHDDGVGAGALLGVELVCQIEQGLEVSFGALAGALGLVQDAPCDDRGVVLVAADHIGQRVLVVGQQLRGGLLLEPADLLAVALIGGEEVHGALHEADGGDFVDDQEALFISHLVQLLGVGVVAGAEAVGTDPLHQLVVALDGGEVEAAAADIGVLVLAEAAQIDGLAVQQEMAVLDLEGADADLLGVFIDHGTAVVDADDDIVQVSSVDVPQLCVLDDEGAFLAGGLSNLGGAVVQLDGDFVVAVGGDGVIDLSALGSQAVLHGVVEDTLGGQSHQLDRAVDAGVVVEVKVGGGDLLAVGQDGGVAGGQHVLVQLVVQQDAELVELVVADDVGDDCVEGQETALVLRHFHAVDEDAGVVGSGAEADGDVLAAPLAGHEEVSLVPEIAAVLAGLLVGEEIAEGCRNGHGDGLRQTVGPVGLNAFALGIEAEAPHAVKADDAAGGGNDRVQQGLVVHCKNLFLVIRKFFWIVLQPLSLTYGLPSLLLGGWQKHGRSGLEQSLSSGTSMTDFSKRE